MAEKTKILIVEQITLTRSILETMLPEKGVKVTAPSSADRLFSEISAHTADLILIDLDNIDRKALQQLETTSELSPGKVWCIGLAKKTSEDLAHRYTSVNLISCIKKPATGQEIKAVIHQCSEDKPKDFIQPPRPALFNMDFAEAFNEIKRLEEKGDNESVCILFRYLDAPESDQALISVVSDVLRKQLNQNINFLLFGLLTGDTGAVNLCASLIEEKRLSQAAPYLILSLKINREPALIPNILSVFRKINYPKIIPVLEKFSRHKNILISLAAITALSGQNPEKANPVLAAHLESSEEIKAYAAAEALGKTGGETALKALVLHIHNKNPQIRKAVATSLISTGSSTVPLLCTRLSSSNDDEIIIASNILGEIGDSGAEDPLCRISTHDNPNIRFSVYEALGKIGSEKAVEELLRGTIDRDYSVVCASVQGLDQNDQVRHESLIRVMETDREIRKNIISAISDMKAVHVFNSLYRSSQTLIDIIKTIKDSKNRDTIQTFLNACTQIKTESVRKGAEMLLNRVLKTLPEIKGRILAVDDSKAVLNLYQSVLSMACFHVVTAENGNDAIEKIRIDNTFDLIITDMNMPGRNGIELTRYIRKHISAAIPIILVTTESEKSQKDQATEAGVDHFLTKPVSKEVLQKKTQELLHI
ncbi:MAG: response regulator [Thermodesulfobacteriota bacterium]|nr:response regulator [Thermodesulfobacteriota bacterium]